MEGKLCDGGVVLTLLSARVLCQAFYLFSRGSHREFCGAPDSLIHRKSGSPRLLGFAWVMDLCPLVDSMYDQTIVTDTTMSLSATGP